MKIVVLQGSPHKNGSTSLLARNFMDGAKEKGHEVILFDVAFLNIHPCSGCLHCGYEGPCAFHDDMKSIRDALLSSDMVVFATPLYYFGMSAQLKIVVDRFCSFNSSLHAKHLKSALLAVSYNDDEWTMEDLEHHYLTLVRYLHLQDLGSVLGLGCGTLSMTKNSAYPSLAYKLGKSI